MCVSTETDLDSDNLTDTPNCESLASTDERRYDALESLVLDVEVNDSEGGSTLVRTAESPSDTATSTAVAEDGGMYVKVVVIPSEAVVADAVMDDGGGPAVKTADIRSRSVVTDATATIAERRRLDIGIRNGSIPGMAYHQGSTSINRGFRNGRNRPIA